jgi:Icc-related predicted phosphoesterase
MRILVFSDLHGQGLRQAGTLIETYLPDWVVLCGDMLPDFNRVRGEGRSLTAQREFWATWRSEFTKHGIPVTLVKGNHEIEGFRDPELERLPAQLVGRVLRLEGIPGEFGRWGYSREFDQMELQVEFDLELQFSPEPWIVLSHVPPYGSRDRSKKGEHIGHRPLFRWLQGSDWPPVLVLCGHVHESFGAEHQGQTLVVNAATGWALVEWNPERAEMLDCGRLVEHMSPWDEP